MATPICAYATWLERLDDEDRAAANAAMYGGESQRRTAALLASAGAPVNHTGVHNHRAGVCRTCATVGARG